MTDNYRIAVLIPSYNSGDLLKPTVENALAVFNAVRVVIDGSTDKSEKSLDQFADTHPNFRMYQNQNNRGKGGAIASVLPKLLDEGFTHVLTMDADGQHPSDRIPDFIRLSKAHPEALIMGKPLFGPDVPTARLKGRKLTIWWTDFETLWTGLGDTLFGMRVYPICKMLEAFEQTSFARGFDFDPEIAVRMAWLGCPPIQLEVPVRYFTKEEGGISHFNYLRDNILLTWLHFRLVPEFLFFRFVSMMKHKKGD